MPARQRRAPTAATAARRGLRFTPQGSLRLGREIDGPGIDGEAARRIEAAFAEGPGAGVLHLGAAETTTALPPDYAFVRELGGLFVGALRGLPDVDRRIAKGEFPEVGADDLARLAEAVPPMAGAEYVGPGVLEGLWQETGLALQAALKASKDTVEAFLHARNPAWFHVGRVHFHLAENRRDADRPFAFLATYTPRLTAQGTTQHVPLRQALEEYGGARNKDRLLSLLVPVRRAATECAWLKALVDDGAIFHPLRWTPPEAFRLLEDAIKLEEAGVVVRLPAGWKGGRPSRPLVQASVGDRPPPTSGSTPCSTSRWGSAWTARR